MSAPSSVYGPVWSWRYGRSLGVDLLMEPAACCFTCVYCQLGGVGDRTAARMVFVPTERVAADLERSRWREADVVTFSGSGEPTLALNLGEAIRLVHRETDRPVVVLTNGLLLGEADVRKDLAGADHVSFKLDVPDEDEMKRINRPAFLPQFDAWLAGVRTFRDAFRGKFSVQVMVLPGTKRFARELAERVASLDPDEVQLNVPSRPVPKAYSLDARGDHQRFMSEHAWRAVPHAELEQLRDAWHQDMHLNVVIPPAPADESCNRASAAV